MQETIRLKLEALPHLPGVYQFFDAKNKIIYIGKAKNLKKRVASYFLKTSNSPKTAILVKQIADIKYIVVENENDALLLESNFIKQYLPRYNLMLKYGTTYPYLCITKEEFPRVFKTRKTFLDGEFFGPYSIGYALTSLLELIKIIYPVRTCKLAITKESIRQKRHKVCLEYHIKNCKGVCCGLQSQDDYTSMINDIRLIAKGSSHIIEKYLLEKIKESSDSLQFEVAQELKQKYDAIADFRKKTIITRLRDCNIDVFSCVSDEQYVFINMLRIVNGSIIQSDTIEYKKNIEEIEGEVFSTGIIELRHKYNSNSKQIIVPFEPDFKIDGVEFVVPKRDYKKDLLNLSIKNALQYKRDKYTQTEKLNKNQRGYSILNEIKELLQLGSIPHKIEIFDNSHTSGQEAVSACVVFNDLKPAKQEYRKYIIQSADKQDDYNSMKEVVFRRYKRHIEENIKLPDLIFVDGGKGHISATMEMLRLLNLNIPVAGLAKNDKHRTNELIYRDKTIGLKPQSSVFNFFSKMQNEVHRFAISFHREKRSKKQVKSELDNIKHIGKATKTALLQHFRSVERIKRASLEELEKTIGKSRAKIVSLHFDSSKNRN